MNRKKLSRLYSIMGLLGIFSLGIYFILANLEDNIVFFYPPSAIEKITSAKTKIRVGGVVQEKSIITLAPNKIRFTLTDYQNNIMVEYSGVLPVLFREKQGIIAEGMLVGNIFIAANLLAKHDENYMPPEISKSLIKKNLP